MEIEEYKERKLELDKQQKQLNLETKTVFEEGLRLFFEKYTKLELICWNQHTPYWQDGDTCYFGVGEFRINTYNEYDYDDTDEELEKLPLEVVTEIREFLQMFNQDNYLEMFGDHQQITITREGISITEYDHE